MKLRDINTMKFRKKPVVIDAVQYTGRNKPEILEFTEGKAMISLDSSIISIPTLEGDMTAVQTDWIIQDVQGEFYPIKDDIFQQTYERLPEEE